MIHNINKLHLKIYSNKKLLFLIVRTFQNINFFFIFGHNKCSLCKHLFILLIYCLKLGNIDWEIMMTFLTDVTPLDILIIIKSTSVMFAINLSTVVHS